MRAAILPCREIKAIWHIASPELLVAKCPPQVPTGIGSGWAATSSRGVRCFESFHRQSATARSSPTSPKGSTSGSRRTMMRNTESVHGPIPLMPARAFSHCCPVRTLARICSDLCRMVTQHRARRSERPRRANISNLVLSRAKGVVSIGYADFTRSASRQATLVEIC